jgi:hypothetical protein
MALIDKLTAIADAIRGKTGKTDEMTLDQMVTEIASISGGGGGDTTIEDGLIEDILTAYENNRVGKISDCVFYGSAITKVTALNAKSIGDQTFKNCKKLVELNAPMVKTVGGEGCSACTALSVLNLTALESVSGNYNFWNCSNLTEVVFSSFIGSIPRCMFQNCSKLKTIVLGASGFTNSATIDQQAFSSCIVLDTIVLHSTSMCALGNVNAFDKTPFASNGTGGTVYVPQTLIESYQTATNWSTLYAAGTCNFVAIEGSEYE